MFLYDWPKNMPLICFIFSLCNKVALKQIMIHVQEGVKKAKYPKLFNIQVTYRSHSSTVLNPVALCKELGCSRIILLFARKNQLLSTSVDMKKLFSLEAKPNRHKIGNVCMKHK